MCVCVCLEVQCEESGHCADTRIFKWSPCFAVQGQCLNQELYSQWLCPIYFHVDRTKAFVTRCSHNYLSTSLTGHEYEKETIFTRINGKHNAVFTDNSRGLLSCSDKIYRRKPTKPAKCLSDNLPIMPVELKMRFIPLMSSQ